jgi:hypothetical protein
MKLYNKSIRFFLKNGLRACLLSLIPGLTGCCPSQHLTVFSQYLTRENRASYFVGTPDPLLNNPPAGQRVYVSWHLPKEYSLKLPLELRIYLRFSNREQKVEVHTICALTGTCVYELLGKNYFDVGGLATYKVELYANEELVEAWRHLMWVELIEFSEPTTEDDTK